MNEILQKLNELSPTYETTLPFSDITVSFKPFKVKDAKNIAIILQENNKRLALKAMLDLVEAQCNKIEISELCLADLEFLFLQIRSKSVDETLHLIKNNEKITINISDVTHRNKIIEEKIELNSHIHIFLQTPKIKDLLKLKTLDKEDLLKSCINKITIKNEVYNLNRYIPEEIKEVLENLPMNVVPKIDKFLDSQPELYVKLNFEDGETEVRGLLNFFTFR
jgi:hypothetical protein